MARLNFSTSSMRVAATVGALSLSACGAHQDVSGSETETRGEAEQGVIASGTTSQASANFRVSRGATVTAVATCPAGSLVVAAIPPSAVCVSSSHAPTPAMGGKSRSSTTIRISCFSRAASTPNAFQGRAQWRSVPFCRLASTSLRVSSGVTTPIAPTPTATSSRAWASCRALPSNWPISLLQRTPASSTSAAGIRIPVKRFISKRLVLA